MSWTDLFPPTPQPAEGAATTALDTVTPSAAPRLGINFVQASAPEASIPISRATISSRGDDDGGDATAMTIQQNLSQYGIAGVVWNCARALIFCLQGQPQLLAKKRVLELGAGTGVVGLAITLAHGRSGSDDDDGDGPLEALVLTDLESVVPLTAQNVHFVARDHANIRHMLDRNALSTQAYCWGDVLSDSLKEYTPDVILCSDCLYEPSQYAKLLDSLLVLTDNSQREKAAAGDSSPVVLIAYKQRIPEREQAFFESASEFFAIAIDVVDGTSCSAVGSDTIYICRLERQKHQQVTISMS